MILPIYSLDWGIFNQSDSSNAFFTINETGNTYIYYKLCFNDGNCIDEWSDVNTSTAAFTNNSDISVNYFNVSTINLSGTTITAWTDVNQSWYYPNATVDALIIGNLSLAYANDTGGKVDGYGAAGNITRWIDGNTIGNSTIYDDGAGNVGIGVSDPANELEVNGDISLSEGGDREIYVNAETVAGNDLTIYSGGGSGSGGDLLLHGGDSGGGGGDVYIDGGNGLTVAAQGDIIIGNSYGHELINNIEPVGFPRMFQCNEEAASMYSNTNYLDVGNQKMDNDTGFTMIRSGSITGVSVNYDALLIGAGVTTLVLEVRKNGVVVWSNSIQKTAGSGIDEYFTQVRDTDTFVAGDTIQVSLTATGGSPGINMVTTNDVICALEVIYD